MEKTKAKVAAAEKAVDPVVEKDVHKERLLEALRQNQDEMDEAELGQSLGFSQGYTVQVIKALLAEGKIVPYSSGKCRYRPAEEKSEGS